MSDSPKLYSDLASWWRLLSAPEDYGEEAAFYRRTLEAASRRPIRTLLELGSGGGNNASHLKPFYELTLVDLAGDMLEQSRELNPECEHIQGDMRTVRLERTFDAVFIHDAICYVSTPEDLKRVMETAFVHCREGGAVLLCPDDVRETYQSRTSHGGHDGSGRALRYLEWSWDPDPADSTTLTDFAYLLREADGKVRIEHDRHVFGLFSRETWLTLMREVGFEARVLPFDHSEVEPRAHEVFVGVKGHVHEVL